MKRMIYADEAVDAVNEVIADYIPTRYGRYEALPLEIALAINRLPSAQAKPVRHGKWELAEDGWYCSACELYPPFDCDPEEEVIPYCPRCGAKMDAERKEE